MMETSLYRKLVRKSSDPNARPEATNPGVGGMLGVLVLPEVDLDDEVWRLEGEVWRLEGEVWRLEGEV